LVAPQAQVDDGLFELLIADRVSRARIFSLIPHFLRGTQATQEPIKTTQAQHVVVTAIEGVLPAHGDGEVISVEAQQLALELLPRQIEVICEPQVDAL
jgi:diacylglycerol kinase family enzyme